MSSDGSHPAAVAVVGSLPGPAEVARVVDRGDAAVVVCEVDQGRLLVVTQWVDGSWVVPTSLGGTVRRSVPRESTTEHPGVVRQLSQSRVRVAKDTGIDWVAVRGVVALDAVSVHVESSIDAQSVSVQRDDDGAFVVLVKTATDERATVSVQTTHGALIVHEP